MELKPLAGLETPVEFLVVLNSVWRVDANSFAPLAAYPFVCSMGFSDRINKIYKIEPPFTDA